MVSRNKFAVVALLGIAAAVMAAFGLAWRAMQHVEPFYAKAIEVESQTLESASQRMEDRVASLLDDDRPPGEWTTVFSDAEVNGWLAVALEENYAELLPPEVSDPRVAFGDDRALVGFHYRGGQIDAIVSLEAEAFMADDDVAAVRLRGARLGSLPLPMSKVVDAINKAADQLQLLVRWTQIEADPVILVSLTGVLSTDEELRRLKLLQLREGELQLTGSTQAREAPKVARQTGG